MAPAKVLILCLVTGAAAGTLYLRPAAETPSSASPARPGAGRLLELASTSCTPCRAMHAELALLREECPALVVEEIDVWRDEDASARFGVKAIPTQLFFDPAGHELERHTGFLGREEIKERFERRGVRCRP